MTATTHHQVTLLLFAVSSNHFHVVASIAFTIRSLHCERRKGFRFFRMPIRITAIHWKYRMQIYCLVFHVVPENLR